MWYIENHKTPDWSSAIARLTSVDNRLSEAIAAVGPCTLSPRSDAFILLCQSIFNQQISMHVATVLFKRFRAVFSRQTPTPAGVKRLLGGEPDSLAGLGLSRQKRIYLLDLAEHFVDGRIRPQQLGSMDDDRVVESLTSVKGIGRWTAEMFLMFGLNRPDVLPVDDLGLQEAVRRVYRLAERPKPAAITDMGERWRPWRTVATWYLWRYSPPSAEPPKPAAKSSVKPTAAQSSTKKSPATSSSIKPRVAAKAAVGTSAKANPTAKGSAATKRTPSSRKANRLKPE